MHALGGVKRNHHMNTRHTQFRKIALAAVAVGTLLTAHGCALFKSPPPQDQETIAQPATKQTPEPKKETKPVEKKQTTKKTKAEDKPAADSTKEMGPGETAQGYVIGGEKGALATDSAQKNGFGGIRSVEPAIVLQGEGPYPTVDDLLLASDEAAEDGRVLGDISPFDAFPDIPGDDTVGRVFKEKGKSGVRIKLFAFNAPGQKHHRRVYGYVVEDTVSGEVHGFFDGDGDGVFEQATLKPVIQPAALTPGS